MTTLTDNPFDEIPLFSECENLDPATVQTIDFAMRLADAAYAGVHACIGQLHQSRLWDRRVAFLDRADDLRRQEQDERMRAAGVVLSEAGIRRDRCSN